MKRKCGRCRGQKTAALALVCIAFGAAVIVVTCISVKLAVVLAAVLLVLLGLSSR